jgi:hypothetical protein
MTTPIQRASGALFGLAFGDALGAPGGATSTDGGTAGAGLAAPLGEVVSQP